MNLTERDKAVIWHPFTPLKGSPIPIAIVKGEGAILFDDAGHSYIDAISSWWVTIHGHGHPYIAEKIYRQALTLEQVIFAGFTHQPAGELAERLLPILPGNFSKIFYSDNGSTSTEVAIKMALQYWWNLQQQANGNGSALLRRKVLAFNDSYHGDTFGAMSVSDRSVFTSAFQDKLFDVEFIDTPDPSNIESLVNFINKNGDGFAAFIYEPLVQGAGGMKIYEAAGLNRLLQAAKQKGIICIADEVMTGFGRTGKWFASAHLEVQPDIICLSKGLTGGTMALGVTAVTQQLLDAFDTSDKHLTFFHGHSFTANPLACTAALASLDLMEQETANTGITMISEQNSRFAQLLDERGSSVVKNLRTAGTILAMEIDRGEDGYLNSVAAEVTASALQKGVYLRPLGNSLYIMPPYCITAAQLHRVYDVIIEILSELEEHK